MAGVRAMRSALLLAIAGALAGALAAPGVPDYALYYTDAHGGDPVAKRGPTTRRALGRAACYEPVQEYWLQRALFDSDGKLLGEPQDLTIDGLCGMGYLSIHPNKSTMLLATTDETPGNVGNIETFTVDLSLPTPITPRKLFTNISALLAPCANAQPRPCVAVNTFHARFSPDGRRIFFAYRAWDAIDEGVGNQAIAVSDADGGNIRPLTFTTAGEYAGINIFDECPAPSRDGSRIFFSRSVDQGMSSYASVASTVTGQVTMMQALPAIAPGAGCPNFVDTEDGVTVIWLGCNASQPDTGCVFAGPQEKQRGVFASRRDARAAWGDIGNQRLTSPAPLAANESAFTYGRVVLYPGAATSTLYWRPMFGISLTDTPITTGSFATSQCDQVHGAPAPPEPATLSCEGCDPSKLFLQQLFVDARTGVARAVSRDTFTACMTPRCSLLARVENV